jgi:hypothetical protein
MDYDIHDVDRHIVVALLSIECLNEIHVRFMTKVFGPVPDLEDIKLWMTKRRSYIPDQRLHEMRVAFYRYQASNLDNARIPVRPRLSSLEPVPFKMQLVPLLPPFVDTAVRSVTPLPVLIILSLMNVFYASLRHISLTYHDTIVIRFRLNVS